VVLGLFPVCVCWELTRLGFGTGHSLCQAGGRCCTGLRCTWCPERTPASTIGRFGQWAGSPLVCRVERRASRGAWFQGEIRMRQKEAIADERQGWEG